MIGKIETDNKIDINNLLSYREKIDTGTAINLTDKIDTYLKQNGASKAGNTISITHNAAIENGRQMIDMQLLIPVNKEIQETEEFKFIKSLKINNALKIRIEGHPNQLEIAVKELSDYIKDNNLKPSTPLMISTVKEAKNPLEIEEMITDIFVGVQ